MILTQGDWCSAGADSNQLAAELNVLCRAQTSILFRIPLSPDTASGGPAPGSYSAPRCAKSWPSPQTLPRCATKVSKHHGAARDPLAWNASNIGSDTLEGRLSVQGG